MTKPIVFEFKMTMKKAIAIWFFSIGTLLATPPSISDQVFSLDENKPAGTLVGTLTASGQGLNFKMVEGNIGGAFALDSLNGKLSVNNSLAIDYEAIKSFILKIKVSNSSGTDSATITVNLNNLNDNRPRIFDKLTIGCNENSPKDDLIHQVFAFDQDGDLNVLVYNLLPPFPDLDNDAQPSVSLDSLSGKIKVFDADEFDYEKYRIIKLSVRVSDGVYADTASYIIELINLNDNKPFLIVDTIRVAENRPLDSKLYTLRAFDFDFPLDTLFFGVYENANPNNNPFEAVRLNAKTGELFVNDSTDFDYELSNQFKLKIWVSDTLFYDTATFVVQLIDLNDTPPVFSSDTVEIDENLPKDALIATLKILDPDTQNDFSYRIVSGNRFDAFYIDNKGVVRVNSPSAIDYELAPNFVLDIEVSDGVFRVNGRLRILLRNFNDNAPIAENPFFLIEENYANNLMVGLLKVNDPDGDTVTFRLISGNKDNAFRLEVSSFVNTARVVVNNSNALDYEKTPLFELMVEVSDGIFFDTANIRVRLLNLNDEPIALRDTTFFVPENQTNLVIGNLRYIDPDDLEPPAFSFINPTYDDSLRIGVFGEIRARNKQVINFEYRNKFSFFVQAFDGVFYDTALINVVILDRNDPPTGIRLSDSIILDRTAAGRTVANIFAIDEDFGDTHSFKIVLDSTTDERFFFIRNNNQLVINQNVDLNLKRLYVFDLTATDKAGLSYEQRMRMRVDITKSNPIEIQGLSLYPNPAKRFATLRLENDLLGELNWQIIDMQGAVRNEASRVKTHFELSENIDLRELTQGLYLIKIQIQNQQAILRLKLE